MYQQHQLKLRPAYQVVPTRRTLIENVAHEVIERDKKGNPIRRFEFRKVAREVSGFMVYFPRGHSIFIESRQALREYGFDIPADMVDMETGNRVQVMDNMDLASSGQAIVDGGQPMSVHDPDPEITEVFSSAMQPRHLEDDGLGAPEKGDTE